MMEHNLQKAMEIYAMVRTNEEHIETAKGLASDLKIAFKHVNADRKAETDGECYGILDAGSVLQLNLEDVRSRTLELLVTMLREKNEVHKTTLSRLGVKFAKAKEPTKLIEHKPAKLRAVE